MLRRHVVWRKDKVALYRYEPITGAAPVRPLLICYALVNARMYSTCSRIDRRAEVAQCRSGCVCHRLGYPDSGDRAWAARLYRGYLQSCVRHVLREHGIDNLNLIGICQGGAFSSATRHCIPSTSAPSPLSRLPLTSRHRRPALQMESRLDTIC